MPQPRLTPTLNNCALHALTPEIAVEIQKYAENLDYDNHHKEAYLRLKNEFAAYYGFRNGRPEDFPWTRFHAILSAYNPFDVQILLGPVLRAFMKESMTGNEFTEMVALAEDIQEADLIRRYTEPQDALQGRYTGINVDELVAFVSKPLGISVHYYDNPETPGIVHLADDAVAQIQLFHSGNINGGADGHWERTADVAERVDYQKDSKLTDILPLLGQDKVVNRYGIFLLQSFILRSHGKKPDTAKEPIQTAKQIQQYVFLLHYVPQDVAKKWIGALLPTTERFIGEYNRAPLEISIPPASLEKALSLPSMHPACLSKDQMAILEQFVEALPHVRQALKTRQNYKLLCQEADHLVSETLRDIKSMEIDFGFCTAEEEVIQRSRELRDELRQKWQALKEKLEERHQPLMTYPQIQQAVEKKNKQIEKMALEMKRSILLEQLGFHTCLGRFEARAVALETQDEPAYAEEATRLRTLVTTLTAVRDEFLQSSKSFPESKRILKRACTTALAVAKPAEGFNLTHYLKSQLSYLTGGRLEQLGLFAPEDKGDPDFTQFETDVIDNAALAEPVRGAPSSF